MGSHKEIMRRRAAAAERRMDGDKKEEQKDTVLLTTTDLTSAAKEMTKGGKKITGLYHPNGRRMEATAENDRVNTSTVANEDAQKDLNVAKVARKYHEHQTHRKKKADRFHKTEADLDDLESERAAKHVLGKTTVGEHVLFQQLFDFFDVDKDKTWGSIEFAQRMTDIGYGTSVEDASNLLYFAGVRDVDRITYNDFLVLMPKLKAFRIILEKDTMRAFQARDEKRTGVVTIKVLRDIIYDIAGPEGMQEKQVDKLVKKADRERTGKISFDFFIRAMYGTAPLIQYKPPKRKNPLAMWLCGRSTFAGDDDSSEEDEIDQRVATMGGPADEKKGATKV